MNERAMASAKGGWFPAWTRLHSTSTAAVMVFCIAVASLCFDVRRQFFATNDDARFPMLARDIIVNGRWLVPHLDGVPHLNKPPLAAWLIALASWPIGSVTAVTALLPSLLAAVTIVMATWWIGARLWTARVGIAASLIVLTMHGVQSLARSPMPDMLMSACLTLALAAFCAHEFLGRRHAGILFYAAIVAAFWAKGPAAIVGVIVPVAFLLMSRRSMKAVFGVRYAVPVALVAVVSWFVVAAAADQRQFASDIVVTDWLQWYVPSALRWTLLTQPFVQCLELAFPWSPIFAVALVTLLPTAHRRPDADRIGFLLVWFAVIVSLIGLSHQQRLRYYLPSVPCAALLIAVWWDRITVKRSVAVLCIVTVVIGCGAWELRETSRRSAASIVLRMLNSDDRLKNAPLYAADVPNLVLEFYLERPVPVWPIDTPAGHGAETAYVVVADRALQSWPNRSRLAGGMLNGRPFSVLSPVRRD